MSSGHTNVSVIYYDGKKQIEHIFELPRYYEPKYATTIRRLMAKYPYNAKQQYGEKPVGKPRIHAIAKSTLVPILGHHELIQGIKDEVCITAESNASLSPGKQETYRNILDKGVVSFGVGWQTFGINVAVPAGVIMPKKRYTLAEQRLFVSANNYELLVNKQQENYRHGIDAKQKLEALLENRAIINDHARLLICNIYGTHGKTALREFVWEKQAGTTDNSPDLYVLRGRMRTTDIPAGLLFPREGEDYIILASARGKKKDSHNELIEIGNDKSINKWCCFIPRKRQINSKLYKMASGDSEDMTLMQEVKEIAIFTSLSKKEFQYIKVNPTLLNVPTSLRCWEEPLMGSASEAAQQMPRGVATPTHIITSIPMAVGLALHEHFTIKNFNAEVDLAQHTEVENSILEGNSCIHTAHIIPTELERHNAGQAITIIRFSKSNSLNCTNFAWGCSYR